MLSQRILGAVAFFYPMKVEGNDQLYKQTSGRGHGNFGEKGDSVAFGLALGELGVVQACLRRRLVCPWLPCVRRAQKVHVSQLQGPVALYG